MRDLLGHIRGSPTLGIIGKSNIITAGQAQAKATTVHPLDNVDVIAG